MTKGVKRRTSESGYSLIEMMVVVGVSGVLAGMAVFQVGSARAGMNGDAALRAVMAQMNQARETSITQRRNMRMAFELGNRVQIIREEINPVPPMTATTVVSTTYFEGNVQYVKLVTADTPDTFGNSSTTGVNLPTATGTPPEVKFSPEGKFLNQDGASVNGTIFIGMVNQPLSARAITIMGSTGRIRAYRWDGLKWVQV